jgi:hypothetical protein
MASEELEVLPDVHPLVLLFGYLPLLLTLGVAAIAAKAIIWFSLLVTGPFIAHLWRTRRRLADATTVQLTRYPEALAAALETLAGLDVRVPGAAPVHFLFPVWDPAVDRDESRTDVTSVLLGMQLPHDARLRSLERLGARSEPRQVESPAQPSAVKLRELAAFLSWLGLALLSVIALLVVSSLAAAAVLYFLGLLLHVVLFAMPHWIARLWRD